VKYTNYFFARSCAVLVTNDKQVELADRVRHLLGARPHNWYI